MIRSTLLIFSLACLSFIGCTFTSTNGANDITEAKSVANLFYNRCRVKDYDRALAFLDQSIEGDKRLKFKSELMVRDSLLGENHWASLMQSQSYTESGFGNPTLGNYELVFKVAYDKDTTNEYFKLVKDTKTDSIKILEYRITRNVAGI